MPEFLPDGRSVLFTILATSGGAQGLTPVSDARVAVFDLRTGTTKTLITGGSDAHYVRSGHFVYGVGGTLQAVAFDLARLEVVGPPTVVLQQVNTTAGSVDFDVARDGTLVHVPGGIPAARRTLVWVDRQGHEDAIKAPARECLYPRVSPDGTRVALDVVDPERSIWTWDFARETLVRITLEPVSGFPAWTPDGRRLVYGRAARSFL